MQKRKAPYVLLLVLLVIIVFIGGINYGKSVESTNKVIKFVLSITPTPSPLPTKAITFTSYTQKGCGLQFLHPDSVTVLKESTNQAVLASKDKTQSLEVNCDKENQLISVVKDPKIATEEVQFKTQTIKARAKTKDQLTFELRNTRNGKLIYVSISKNLYPLFENTLQYLP